MAGPSPAVALARVAVRRALLELGLGEDRPASGPVEPAPDAPLVLVACSGGADSLALAAATAFVAPRLGLRAGAVIVDHGLQHGSADIAAAAAQQASDVLGREAGPAAPVEVIPVTVVPDGAGPEGEARAARYAAFVEVVDRLGASALLLGHTLDDQAEQVLLGLARGSGARSLSGMASVRPLRGSAAPSPLGSAAPPAWVVRPFLQVSREQTEMVCADLGLTPWQDPHNADERFTRVRARTVMRVLEEAFGPGVREALGRTALLLRDDAELLDELTQTAAVGVGESPWQVSEVLALPRSMRTRLWQRSALAAGSPGTDLNAGHLLAVDSLLTDWHGQGPIHLPGGVRAGRSQGRLWLRGDAERTMAP